MKIFFCCPVNKQNNSTIFTKEGFTDTKWSIKKIYTALFNAIQNIWMKFCKCLCHPKPKEIVHKVASLANEPGSESQIILKQSTVGAQIVKEPVLTQNDSDRSGLDDLGESVYMVQNDEALSLTDDFYSEPEEEGSQTSNLQGSEKPVSNDLERSIYFVQKSEVNEGQNANAEPPSRPKTRQSNPRGWFAR